MSLVKSSDLPSCYVQQIKFFDAEHFEHFEYLNSIIKSFATGRSPILNIYHLGGDLGSNWLIENFIANNVAEH